MTDQGCYPAQWYYYWHWHDGTPKEFGTRARPAEAHIYPEPQQREGLLRFEADHTQFTPWYGRPKRLHANDCPVWLANHHADWFNCCPPTYNISRVLGNDVVPRGYIQPFDPNPDLAHVAQVELDYLAEQQHQRDCQNRNNDRPYDPDRGPCCKAPDLAPEVLLMHERGMEAVPIDMQPETDEGEMPIQIADEGDRTPYHIPPREMQALAEWERKSWMDGPIYRWHYEPTENGLKVAFDTLRHKASGVYVTPQLTKEEKDRLVQLRIEIDKAENNLPNPKQLAADLEMVNALRMEWGSKWFLHSPANPGLPLHPFEMADMDDPYRYAFHDEDTRHMDTDYAGPVDLSYDLDDDDMTRHHQSVVVSATGDQIALDIDDDDLHSNLTAQGVGVDMSGMSYR